MSGREWVLSAYLTEGLWELGQPTTFPLQQAVKPPLHPQRHPAVAAQNRPRLTTKSSQESCSRLLTPIKLCASCNDLDSSKPFPSTLHPFLPFPPKNSASSEAIRRAGPRRSARSLVLSCDLFYDPHFSAVSARFSRCFSIAFFSSTHSETPTVHSHRSPPSL